MEQQSPVAGAGESPDPKHHLVDIIRVRAHIHRVKSLLIQRRDLSWIRKKDLVILRSQQYRMQARVRFLSLPANCVVRFFLVIKLIALF
jgi:hypothetical protein